MVEILHDNQIIHLFTSTNCSLRQKYIIKRSHKYVLSDIHSLGFVVSRNPEAELSRLILVKFSVVRLGGTDSNFFKQIPETVNGVNELPLFVKTNRWISVTPQLRTSNLKHSLIPVTGNNNSDF